jgi:hypothetical protein
VLARAAQGAGGSKTFAIGGWRLKLEREDGK